MFAAASHLGCALEARRRNGERRRATSFEFERGSKFGPEPALVPAGSRIFRRRPQKRVLALFEDEGLIHETAKQLAGAAKRDGADVSFRRAKQTNPKGKPRAEIVELLKVENRNPLRRPRDRHVSPLALAASYERGRAEGKRTSIREASKVKSFDRAILSSSC